MRPEHAILLPPAALAFVTGFVLLKTASNRIDELRTRRIHPQQVATSKMAAEKFENIQASDNLRNLFETPVLFYALCGFLAITGLTTVLLLACAWGYVFLRIAHTWIQLTNNKVVRRFQVFVASSMVLYAMWGIFAVRLVAAK